MTDTPRLRIGDMLVSAGLIDEAQLARALDSQKTSGRRLGEELVALGVLAEAQMTQILSNQLSLPWVSLYHVEFSRELLNLVPADVALRYHLVPVYVRKVRRQGDTLFVAMDDPTNGQALEVVSAACGLPAKPMVAAPTDILSAIRIYYFGGRLPGEAAAAPPGPPVESEPPPAAREAAPRSAKPAAAAPVVEPPASTAEPVAEPPPAATPAPEAEPVAEPPPEASPAPEAPPVVQRPAKKAAGAGRPGGGPRMITLTLLDGTTVRLPAPGGATGPKPQETLTATDLIAALLAKAQGADVSDVLPEDRWEVLFATLLRILIRKGLIADWEFVDELKKRQG